MAAIFSNGLQNGGIQWHDVFGNAYSEIYAPQNIYIESKLNVLHLLVSEVDVLLCKWPPFFKWPPNGGIQFHDVLGNTFSEIYAPQNIYIQSKLKALRLLVS